MTCNNNRCDAADYNSCWMECQNCGNGVCNAQEDPSSCGDCYCGDNRCSRTETAKGCPEDCGQVAECPNGICDAGENSNNCPADCGSDPVCGDMKCEPGEEQTCLQDCAAITCGDGSCTRAERFYCVPDCGTTCGDGACEITDLFLCPEECDFEGFPIPLGAPGTPFPAPEAP